MMDPGMMSQVCVQRYEVGVGPRGVLVALYKARYCKATEDLGGQRAQSTRVRVGVQAKFIRRSGGRGEGATEMLRRARIELTEAQIPPA